MAQSAVVEALETLNVQVSINVLFKLLTINTLSRPR
jgi:hypothetical protein